MQSTYLSFAAGSPMKACARRGFTLTEMAMVMGVIGAIMGAIWWAGSNAQEMQRDNKAVSELQDTVQGVLNLMAGQSFQITGLATANMITAQAIPNTYVDLAAPMTADTPWGSGTFDVWVIAPKQFRVSFYTVSWKGCVALLLQGTACQAGQAGCPLDVLTADGTAGNTLGPNATTGWATAMTPSVANTMCAANSSSTNSVELDYSL